MVDRSAGQEGKTLEWAVACRALPGETDCGDKALVISASETTSLLAVVDGLGHGPQAAFAAELAIARLREHRGSLSSAIQEAHEALRDTRGVAMGVALLDRANGTLTWVGVGNVQGRVVPSDRNAPAHSMMVTAGIAGHRLPQLHPVSIPIRRGDLVLLATDGLREGFADSLDRRGSPSDIAQRVLDEFHRTEDDGLLLMARYLERQW